MENRNGTEMGFTVSVIAGSILYGCPHRRIVRVCAISAIDLLGEGPKQRP